MTNKLYFKVLTTGTLVFGLAATAELPIVYGLALAESQI